MSFTPVKMFLITAILFVLAACSPTAVKPTPDDRAQWQARMLRLSQSLSAILPLVISKKEYDNPKNYRVIEREVKDLAKLAHDVKGTKAKPDGDPGMEFVSKKFSEDMAEAVKQLNVGNRTYARHLVRNTVNYCISCHTQTDRGRQDIGLNFAFADLKSFTPIERAQYHMAIREFDKGLQDFDEAVNVPQFNEDFQTLELTAERALAVAIRVKRDPNLANEIVSRILDSKWAPVYLRLNAREWKSSITAWEKSDLKKKSLKKAQNSKQNLEEAKRLLSAAWKQTASSTRNRAGLVDFLRASTLLHDLFSANDAASVYGEALYYAGLAAESLREINLWTLHEAYYEACIRHQPYTDLAKKCYLRFEALQLSAYAAYDGSFVPAGVRDHLSELKSLAEKQEGDFLDWGFID